jgi:hypothetical protein
MRRTLVATLMAVVFGLFSMPAVQAAPGNGSAVESALKTISPVKDVQFFRRRRRRRCAFVHHWRSRSRQRCFD